MDRTIIEAKIQQNKDDQCKLKEEQKRLEMEFAVTGITYSIGDVLIDSYFGELKVIKTRRNYFGILICENNTLWQCTYDKIIEGKAKNLFQITQDELNSFPSDFAPDWRKK